MHNFSLRLSILFATLAAFSSSWAVNVGPVSAVPYFFIFSVLGFLFFVMGSGLRIDRLKTYELGFGLLLIWMMVGFFYSDNKQAVISVALIYLSCFVGLLFFRRAAFDRRSFFLICCSVVAGCAVMVFDVLYFGIDHLSNIEDVERATSGELNGNYVAYAIVTSLPVALILLYEFGKGRLIFSIFLCLYIALAFISVVFSGSRGAIFAFSGCMVFSAISNRKYRGFFLLLGGFVVYFVFFVAENFIPGVISSRVSTVLNFIMFDFSSVDYTGREIVWPIALDVFANNPLAGVGVGGFPFYNPYEIPAHNFVLSIAAEMGIVGLVLFVFTIFLMFKEIILTKNSGYVYSCMLIFCWLVVALTGVWERAPFAWIVFALILAYPKVNNRRIVVDSGQI